MSADVAEPLESLPSVPMDRETSFQSHGLHGFNPSEVEEEEDELQIDEDARDKEQIPLPRQRNVRSDTDFELATRPNHNQQFEEEEEDDVSSSFLQQHEFLESDSEDEAERKRFLAAAEAEERATQEAATSSNREASKKGKDLPSEMPKAPSKKKTKLRSQSLSEKHLEREKKRMEKERLEAAKERCRDVRDDYSARLEVRMPPKLSTKEMMDLTACYKKPTPVNKGNSSATNILKRLAPQVPSNFIASLPHVARSFDGPKKLPKMNPNAMMVFETPKQTPLKDSSSFSTLKNSRELKFFLNRQISKDRSKILEKAESLKKLDEEDFSGGEEEEEEEEVEEDEAGEEAGEEGVHGDTQETETVPPPRPQVDEGVSQIPAAQSSSLRLPSPFAPHGDSDDDLDIDSVLGTGPQSTSLPPVTALQDEKEEDMASHNEAPLPEPTLEVSSNEGKETMKMSVSESVPMGGDEIQHDTEHAFADADEKTMEDEKNIEDDLQETHHSPLNDDYAENYDNDHDYIDESHCSITPYQAMNEDSNQRSSSPELFDESSQPTSTQMSTDATTVSLHMTLSDRPTDSVQILHRQTRETKTFCRKRLDHLLSIHSGVRESQGQSQVSNSFSDSFFNERPGEVVRTLSDSQRADICSGDFSRPSIGSRTSNASHMHTLLEESSTQPLPSTLPIVTDEDKTVSSRTSHPPLDNKSSIMDDKLIVVDEDHDQTSDHEDEGEGEGEGEDESDHGPDSNEDSSSQIHKQNHSMFDAEAEEASDEEENSEEDDEEEDEEDDEEGDLTDLVDDRDHGEDQQNVYSRFDIEDDEDEDNMLQAVARKYVRSDSYEPPTQPISDEPEEKNHSRTKKAGGKAKKLKRKQRRDNQHGGEDSDVDRDAEQNPSLTAINSQMELFGETPSELLFEPESSDEDIDTVQVIRSYEKFCARKESTSSHNEISSLSEESLQRQRFKVTNNTLAAPPKKRSHSLGNGAGRLFGQFSSKGGQNMSLGQPTALKSNCGSFLLRSPEALKKISSLTSNKLSTGNNVYVFSVTKDESSQGATSALKRELDLEGSNQATSKRPKLVRGTSMLEETSNQGHSNQASRSGFSRSMTTTHSTHSNGGSSSSSNAPMTHQSNSSTSNVFAQKNATLLLAFGNKKKQSSSHH